MKALIASLLLLATIALICSPLYIVWSAFVLEASATIRFVMFLIGLAQCRLIKPLSIITGKELWI